MGTPNLLSLNGHVSCFQCFTIISNTSMDLLVHVSGTYFKVFQYIYICVYIYIYIYIYIYSTNNTPFYYKIFYHKIISM